MDLSRASKIGIQAAIVVIGGVQLIMDVIGIKTSISNRNKKAIVKSTAIAFKACSRNQLAIKAFKIAWEEAKGSYTKQARAILQFLKDIDPNLLLDIISSLLKSLSWYDIMKSIAVVTANIAAASASAGVAIAIKIGLALDSAVGLLWDIQKLCELL